MTSAFSPVAAVGGFAGASIRMAIQNGVARGVFSNESGLGSAPIAAAAAKTNEPVEQGLISMTGTFIDTLIICTLTGLTILVTGVWSGDLNGVALTQSAFSTVFSHFGPALLTIFLVLFAFTTILGWNYYGERCFEFLFWCSFYLALPCGLCAHGLVGRIYRVGYGLDYRRYCQCLDGSAKLDCPLSFIASRYC